MHFVTYVMVDRLEDAAIEVDERVERYSEHLEVEEYPDECWCIGEIASMESRKKVEEEYKSMGQLRDEHNALVEEAKSPELKELEAIPFKERTKNDNKKIRRLSNKLDVVSWCEYTKKYHDLYREFCAEHPDRAKSNPECAECAGTGERMSTCNPDGRWDWYRIGGRWDGYIRGMDPLEEATGFNFEQQFEGVERNHILASELLPFIRDGVREPCAMIDVDGDWHESGNSWSADPTAVESWREQVIDMLERNPDNYVIACDMHC